MPNKYFIVFCILFCSFAGNAKSYEDISKKDEYSFSPVATKAYELVTSLRFQEAYSKLNQLKQEDPANLSAVYIEDYIDFLALLISEDKALYEKLNRNQDIRLKKLENGSVNSPYHLYFQAEVYLHWAAIEIKFGNYLSSFSNAYSAYKLLEKNKKAFPDFIPNNKGLGIMHAIIGSIPDHYRKGLRIISGMNGNLTQGLNEIKAVLDYADKKPFIFADETRVIYTFLLLHLANQPDNAWDKLLTSKLNYKDNPLMAYVYANVAYHTNRNDEAIKILTERKQDKSFFPLDIADLLLGRAKLNHLDKDANVPLQNFIRNYKGKNYLKEANLLLSWHYAIQGDKNTSDKYLRQVKNIGETNIESDKAALKEAKKGKLSPTQLLRARLLYDGGYGKEAWHEVQCLTVNSFTDKAYKLECLYRKGRILQLLNKNEDAKDQYLEVLNLGASSPYYFACNAALQLGLIYEKEKMLNLAKTYYNQCLELDPEDYADSLHARAKAGLQRVK